MLPVSMLMVEHRLIERMIKLMSAQLQDITGGRDVDTVFINEAVDFIRTYTDKCHHGKEESILFRDAGMKPLSAQLRIILDELLAEHTIGRNATGALAKANLEYSGGNAAAKEEIKSRLKELADFYPKHIEKEDKHFFVQSMEYFSAAEIDRMLKAFQEYDQNFIHQIYRQKVENYEGQTGQK